MSSIHSDVSLLKSLLFESAYEDLKALTESRYYIYRDNAYAAAGISRQNISDTRCILSLLRFQQLFIVAIRTPDK